VLLLLLLLLVTAGCAAGQYLVNDPATCTDCPVGSYCPGGTATQSVIYSCNWANNATTAGLTTKAVRSTSRAACGERYQQQQQQQQQQLLLSLNLAARCYVLCMLRDMPSLLCNGTSPCTLLAGTMRPCLHCHSITGHAPEHDCLCSCT
jgi:hypothetical protein